MLSLDPAVVISFVLILASALGFFGWDNFFVRWSEKVRDKNQSVDFLLRLFSFTPFPVAILFLVPVIYFWARNANENLMILIATPSLALGAAFTGKYVFGRRRPFGNTTYLGKIDSAFPSAHAAGSFSAALILAQLFPPLASLALAFAGIVALSRIYLQLHFFSDIAGGILLAYLAMLLTTRTDFLEFWWNLFLRIT